MTTTLIDIAWLVGVMAFLFGVGYAVLHDYPIRGVVAGAITVLTLLWALLFFLAR